MAGQTEICSLDYLTGTLATAYKGLITSLVAKDFCISEEDGTARIGGTLLSIPQGDYSAALIRRGAELARVPLRDGAFIFRTETGLITDAEDLQIDIIQNGRHIGTFLLKKDSAGGHFISALDISRELTGINLKLLTERLRESPGIYRKAEKLVSDILSAKRDWMKFSEEINTLGRDLFWSEGDIFFDWFPVLARFSAQACIQLPSSSKPVTNFLSLLQSALDRTHPEDRSRSMSARWLAEAEGVPLSSRLEQAERLLSKIHERFPDLDQGPVIKSLISSFLERVTLAPWIGNQVIGRMADFIADSDRENLYRYSEEKGAGILKNLSGAEGLFSGGDYAAFFKAMESLGSELPEENEISDIFFSVAVKSLTARSAGAVASAVYEFISDTGRGPAETYTGAARDTVEFLKRLIGLEMPGTAAAFLVRTGTGDFPLKEDILLNDGLATAVLDSGSKELIGSYTDLLKGIIIPSPRISGFSGESWAEIANPLHLERISRFLSVIRIDMNVFREVLVHVICNLFVTGTFIPDDRLFQREISSYLNCDTFRDRFLLNYLLLKKLPVYYNEVGASGVIRDYSTEIDSWGNDPILYFLRKQIHVNASNNNIRMVRQVLTAWFMDNPELLRDVVPEEVYRKLDYGLMKGYSNAVRPVFRKLGAGEYDRFSPEKLLSLSESDLEETVRELRIPAEQGRKIVLLCLLYRELHRKYSFSCGPGGGGCAEKMSRYTDSITEMKKAVVSSRKTTPEESIYRKRHIAFGIPSIMGTYHEEKFDALGRLFRDEECLRVTLEKISGKIGIEDKHSGSEEPGWLRFLQTFAMLFRIHDLGNFQVDEVLEILRSGRLHYSQVVDLLRIWQKELTWMVESLTRVFYKPLTSVLKVLPCADLPEHLARLNPESEDFPDKVADVVIRDIMNSIAGFFELDRFLSTLISHFRERSLAGDELLSDGISAKQAFYDLSLLSDTDSMRLSPLIGGKAKNLVYLRNRGMRVPSAVVFPAGVTPETGAYLKSARFESDIRKAVEVLEKKTGKVFGGEKDPLFLSVRSGSYISMPGILSSVLYCGMNSRTVAALIEETGDQWFGWDSYRRFIEHYASVVLGLDLQRFEKMADDFSRSEGKSREELTADQKREICYLFLNEITNAGKAIPDDPFIQLAECIRAVYASWSGIKAVQFRKALEVSAFWGTSVILMQMVYGNGPGAGSSVFFTRNPFSMVEKIYGETRERSTGDDLVYGLFTNAPLSAGQEGQKRQSLEETDPGLFALHAEAAREIESAMGGLPQEVETTYTRSPDGSRIIHILQARRMEFRLGRTTEFSDICRMPDNIIGRGIGVHGGALSGIAVFSNSPARIARIKQETSLPAILLRELTSTDDVSLMPLVRGLLTSKGGAASHASVLAQKFDLTAVAGCGALSILEDENGALYAKLGDYRIEEGSAISLDGSTGLVYSGLCLLTVKREYP